MFVNLVKTDESKIVYRRSLAVRFAILLILGSFDVFSYIAFKYQISVIPFGDNEYVYSVPILLVVLINYVTLRFTGPDDLELDISRQSYIKRVGYPMFAKVQTGSFGDFYGLCVRPVTNRKKVIKSYQIELDWNTPDSKSLVLAETRSSEEATAELHKLAHRLGDIPIAKE